MCLICFTDRWCELCEVLTAVVGCARIKLAEKQYMDAFNDELESFKDRIQKRAQAKIEDAMRQVEEVDHYEALLYLSLSVCILTAIFQVDLGQEVPECLHSGYYWS